LNLRVPWKLSSGLSSSDQLHRVSLVKYVLYVGITNHTKFKFVDSNNLK
jgi:hypothetical protein